MKRILGIVGFFLLFLSAQAQIFNPVKWEFTQKEIAEGEIELQLKAVIQEHWHLYSQFISDDGPVPTTFTFSPNSGYSLLGEVSEGAPIEEYDPNFEMNLKYFENEALFTQKIKVNSQADFQLKGEVNFMVCDEAQCLPPDIAEFSFDIKGVKSETSTSEILTQEDTKTEENKGFWGLFFLAFLSGFAALLTPCVFPMIPMTVSFFTKQSKTKAKGITNAIFYGISIILIYVGLGVGVSAIFGADALNNMATNVYFNIAFFLLLVVFAASFLGAFEIQLPASWTNKSVEAENKGGWLGIFFMAFTLALVSFSCTGPIVGTLLVQAATGGYLAPIVGMLGFSLAIALPFALFAAFPGWLNSLPQSGGWLNSVKVVLGFLELALAFKFLSNADLVLQSHLLERELFIAIWIVIFTLLTMYLLGFLRFSHDSPLTYISVNRLFLAILSATLTVYMIPGLWGAPLKWINAFPPPLEYSESPQGLGGSSSALSSAANQESDQHIGPQGIMVFHDYDKGMLYAQQHNKPVVIDFTGWACVNCRKMEEQVWSDAQVKSILNEKVVLISLHVDEREELPKEEQYETSFAGKTKKVKTTGDKWMVLQANKYGTNSQPFYVFLDNEAQSLIEPANFQDYGTVPLFLDWLNRGLTAYNQ